MATSSSPITSGGMTDDQFRNFLAEQSAAGGRTPYDASTQNLSDTLWGQQQDTTVDLLNEGQQGLLEGLTSGAQGMLPDIFGGIQGEINDPRNSYQGLEDFEGQFSRQFGDPLRQQYEGDLRDLAASGGGELMSGGTNSRNFRAMRQLNTGLASARANMMMQERAREQAANESALGRRNSMMQLGANLAMQPLNVKTEDHIISNQGGLLSGLAAGGTAMEGIGKGITALQGGGASGTK